MSRKFVYRVSGFSAVLDLRPVEFEGRLADVRACSVCDVLPEKVAFLPCGHLLCGSCFGGSVARGHICALDGRLFDECLVEWLNFTEEWLAKTNVSRSICLLFIVAVVVVRLGCEVLLRFQGMEGGRR